MLVYAVVQAVNYAAFSAVVLHAIVAEAVAALVCVALALPAVAWLERRQSPRDSRAAALS